MCQAQRIHSLFIEAQMINAAQKVCTQRIVDDWGNTCYRFKDGSMLHLMVNGIHRWQAPEYAPVYDSTGRLMASVARVDEPQKFVIAHDLKGFFNAQSGCWVAEKEFATRYATQRDAFKAARAEFETDLTAFRIAEATA